MKEKKIFINPEAVLIRTLLIVGFLCFVSSVIFHYKSIFKPLAYITGSLWLPMFLAIMEINGTNGLKKFRQKSWRAILRFLKRRNYYRQLSQLLEKKQSKIGKIYTLVFLAIISIVALAFLSNLIPMAVANIIRLINYLSSLVPSGS